MGNDADGLDILFFAEAAGNDTAKPTFAETAGIRPHAMHDFDDRVG